MENFRYKMLDTSDRILYNKCIIICLYYKKGTVITKLRNIMGTDLKDTNLTRLAKCADELGFVSKAVRVDQDGFLSEFTLPCIAKTLSHDWLIFGFTRE